ncbi:CLUMA_CG010140, isoform A [Clunio marinus]|uniref:CLUMA_CG010140, isoform A n=1 Tax=Clunio marinus TaxID=568069 RepID=A0A1J1ICN3_9DIPT|nr:CLUMA_CG010140, isoform A [Clunio marinus]
MKRQSTTSTFNISMEMGRNIKRYFAVGLTCKIRESSNFIAQGKASDFECMKINFLRRELEKHFFEFSF